jgi:hypothetical protein
MRLQGLLGWGVGAVLVTASASGAAEPKQSAVYRGVSTAVKFDISPPLRSIPPQPAVEEEEERDKFEERRSGLEKPVGPGGVDTAVQRTAGGGRIPSPSVSFDGFSGTGATPPDPNGDVGPNHYVMMANTRFAIYSKTGTLLFGPVNINTLWAGFGGPCQAENAGDPVVLYDQLADRWLLTQFTAAGPTFFNCVAVSQTPDPTGAYFRYAFTTGVNFPDYPKYGVWPDAYYIATREFDPGGAFAGVGAYALNRAQIIAGNPAAQVISFIAPPGGTPYNTGDGLLPADFDGTTLPPAGSPEFYAGTTDLGGPYGAPSDAITLWKFVVDFVTPVNSSFTLTNTIPVATFDSIFPCTPTARECIPQPGTAVKIDILSYRQRPLHRLAYRNYGTHESLVTNQSVEAVPNIAGVRWYELRDPNGAPNIFQQGTYAPGATDGIHRWMGSIAMDAVGNMGLGFSASDATVTFPSIWYTGRLAADPPGTMPQGEGVIVNGTGSQTSTGHRWGDYTSMSVDPSDDCTLWYMNEYYPVTSATAWRLRVGAFKFPDCPAGGGSGIQGTVTAFGGGPLAGVAVTPNAGAPTTTDGAGHYLLSLPAGTYDVTYSLAGYYPQTVSGIVVPPATTVTQDAVLTAVGGGPDLSIGDASIAEGNAGNTALFLPVTLSVPSGSTITADFTTQDGTATTADNDYVPIAGTIVFNPGETSHNVTVSVVGDLTVEPDENFFVSLSNVTSANVLDGIGEGTIINDDFPLPQASKTELIHGSNLGRNLVVPDFFPIRTHVHQSWEVVVDATTGDIVGSGGPEVVRLDSDGTTVIQTATAIGTGVSKSLRWENAGATGFDGFVRVQSLGCTTNCTPEDSYRIRSYDTSYAISRFNNSATQITILVIQNTSTDTVTGTIWLWDTTGAPVTTQPLNLTANATLVLNTAGVAPGAAGTITVTHNGRYASLAGKAVAVEPATGFTFDTPMVPKTR